MKTARTITDKQRASRAASIGAGESTAAAHTGASGRLSAAERHRQIAESAYLRAAARGFAGDQSLDDWLAAEREIDSR